MSPHIHVWVEDSHDQETGHGSGHCEVCWEQYADGMHVEPGSMLDAWVDLS